MFVYPIDCNDNGVSNKYFILEYQPYELSTIISNFNNYNTNDHEMQLQCFNEAVCVSEKILIQTLKKFINNSYTYQLNLSNFNDSFDICSKSAYPEIMYIDNEYNINTYLRKFDPLQTIKFIIAKRSDNYYCLWTVSTEEKFKILLPTSFQCVPSNVQNSLYVSKRS